MKWPRKLHEEEETWRRHRPNPKLARRKPPRPRDIKSGGGNYGKWKCALAARSILAHYRTNKSDTFILSFHQSDFSGLSVDQVGNAAAADSNSFWDRRRFHDPPVAQLPQRPLSFIVGCLSVGILNSSNQVIQLNHSPTLATPPPHLNGRTKKGLEELVYHH